MGVLVILLIVNCPEIWLQGCWLLNSRSALTTGTAVDPVPTLSCSESTFQTWIQAEALLPPVHRGRAHSREGPRHHLRLGGTGPEGKSEERQALPRESAQGCLQKSNSRTPEHDTQKPWSEGPCQSNQFLCLTRVLLPVPHQ